MVQNVKLSGTRSPLLWLLSLLILVILGAGLVVLLIWLPQRQIEQHYQAGVAFQSAEEWDMAFASFVKVIQLDADYKDTQSRLAAVKQAQATTQSEGVSLGAMATVGSAGSAAAGSDPGATATAAAQVVAATATAAALSVLQESEQATAAAQVAASTVTAVTLRIMQQNEQATATAAMADATATAAGLSAIQQSEQATATAQSLDMAATRAGQSAVETDSVAEFTSGVYKVEVPGHRPYNSTWTVEISGTNIVGLSEWDCCPGHRIDPISGTIVGNKLIIQRDCSGQGSGACSQTYTGTITDNVITGEYTGNTFSGSWPWMLYIQ